MEEISPLWPKYRAILDLPPQEARASLERWSEWLPIEIERTLERYKQFDHEAEDEETKSAEEAVYRRLFCLRAKWSLLQLPIDVLLAARKRLLGELPPVNSDGEYIISSDEMLLLVGAFWDRWEYRENYVWLVRKAEAKAKRAREIKSIFADLRKELK